VTANAEILKLIGRQTPLFDADLHRLDGQLHEMVNHARFLVIGGAGSIGQAVVREIFKRTPDVLHVVDISENNMVELVRDIRSTLGYNAKDFRTFAIDCGGREFEAFVAAEGPYDYIFNLSALKHVRSEKDQYTLMRMIEVNIFNTLKTLDLTRSGGARKYFCVSTDKAANPVNLMGASKRIMEMFLMRESLTQEISMARFANSAFSDGSLLHSFNQRFIKGQPLVAPTDVRRYFVTPQESGELCLLSGLLGNNRDILFPKPSEKLHLISFADIAKGYLNMRGFDAYECDSETEARARVAELLPLKKWPCYFSDSDTTGEKQCEEFFTSNERLDFCRFESVGVIENEPHYDSVKLDNFSDEIKILRESGKWTKIEIVEKFLDILPGFHHKETGRHLDQKM
jgi:FlaA1/EpsC-like NDP-sugar epimerase